MTTHTGSSPAPHGGGDTLGTVLGLAGVVLAVAVMVFRPALPYEINSSLGMALLVCSSAALVWLINLGVRWRRQQQRPRGFRRTTSITGVLGVLLILAAMQVQETGVRTAHCEFGVHGVGYGMVWAKVEPREPGKKYQVTVVWAGWTGRPEPVVLNQATFFTFLKRDVYSPAADVITDHDAKIICGDGRPPADEDQIHLVGADWIRGKATPVARR
ncbi:hypothetical protein [Micromonospora sp. NPDC005237]|uniref:hypothetical protein n=1 Tax=Micromonospora sp. NPDC005237 TaxID=3155113 RepID=UPI0033B4AFDF